MWQPVITFVDAYLRIRKRLVTHLLKWRGVMIALAALWVLLTGSVATAQPKLSLPPGVQLPDTLQAGKPYTFQLIYQDKKGDPIRKAKSLLIRQGRTAGEAPKGADNIGGEVEDGARISWTVNSFEQGPNTIYFEVTNDTGTKVRYPKADDAPYVVVVEAIGTKLITLGLGLVICLALVPLITYLLARSINPRGDPSRTARIGLWVGILLACLLFIYLFLGMFGPLVYAILIIGLLALPILLLNRR